MLIKKFRRRKAVLERENLEHGDFSWHILFTNFLNLKCASIHGRS